MIITDTFPIEITADPGMMLTNGEAYSDYIILGVCDKPSNWHEIPIEEVPPDEQLSIENH